MTLPSKRKQNISSESSPRHPNTDGELDIYCKSDENTSDEEEMNESKKQYVVLINFSLPMFTETDAQTMRFINTVAMGRYSKDYYPCDEVYKPYRYQNDENERKLEQFLNKVKSYSVVLQDMSVYGFYKWCIKNDVTQFFGNSWPEILQEKFYDEAAQDALKEPQNE